MKASLHSVKKHRFRFRLLPLTLALCLLLGGCQPSVPTEPAETDGDGTVLELPTIDGEETTAGEPPMYLEPADSTLPCIFIETANGKPITSTVRYSSATLTVTGSHYEYYNITVETQIRGRGHSSFDRKAPQTDYASKNSYRLKLTEKTNLLGVGDSPDRDWVLISGKYDISALRNYLVWHLANQLGTIPYVPSCTWVNLYGHGDFRGMYTLAEKIEVASDRVNIDDSPSTDPDTVGYLVEYDLRGANESGAIEGRDYFYIPGMDETFAWSVKSEVHGFEVTAAIREHLIACNKAIMSGNREHMEEYVDLNSFIDMFILQELTKNPDAGCSSFFMQRDVGGKLYLTAPWDFDFAMGAYSVSRFTSGMVADGQGVASHPWFEFLAKQPWFMSMVLKRMEEMEGYVNLTLANVKGVMPFLEEAADMNHARWNLYGVKFSEYPSNQVTIQRKDYADHVDFLVSWVEERWKKMKIEVKALT